MIGRSDFQHPHGEWRPVIFWSWNGMLEYDRLRSQIRQMKEAGIGGFFMHARAGIQTPYLRQEWFGMVQFCLEEARRNGMQAWAYDEYGWPSGYAGGEVPRLGAAYRAKALVELERRETDEAYRLLWHDGQLGRYYYQWTAPLGNPRFLGASGVDLMNPDVVQAFIRHTHCVYEEHVGEAFGTAIPGIFSDEASLMMERGGTANALPWTEGFQSRFQEAYGYDLIPHLASLFHCAGERYREIRYDYWRLMVELLVNHYSKPIFEWCGARGLAFTGHYMGEDHLTKIMRYLGDPMPHYEYMHIPGLDYLGRQIHKSDTELCAAGGTVMTVKQVTSAARQLNKPRVLSELFGGAGQMFDLRMQKWMIDWHLVLGVNMFTPHLLPYSMLGVAKRDWPPVIGPQQPWWSHAGQLHDYLARVSYALSQGERQVPLLVLHPMESAWELYRPQETGAVEALSDRLAELSLRLLDAQLDFDYGNEAIVARHGRVEGGQLMVGSAAYKGVVIPVCTRLRPSTLELLRQFHGEGGGIWYDEWPSATIPGLLETASLIPAARRLDIEELRLVQPALCRFYGKEGDPPIWLHERQAAGERLLFLSNLSMSGQVRGELRIPGGARGGLYCWDGETGEVSRVAATAGEDGALSVRVSFRPRQSLLLEWKEGADAEAAGGQEEGIAASHSGPAVRLNEERTYGGTVEIGGFNVAGGDDNLLLLDQFQCRDEEGGGWHQPACAQDTEIASMRTRLVRTAVAVSSEGLPAPVRLIAEPGICHSVRWDGVMLERTEADWVDPEYEGYAVPEQLLGPGIHYAEIELRTECRELENMYLRGNFRVVRCGPKQFRLHPWNGDCDPSDLVNSGYPFFSGSLSLRTEFHWTGDAGEEHGSRWHIYCEEPQFAGAVLEINGHAAAARVWEPWAWDVTDWLVPGQNELVFHVVNTLRNVYGPHYVPDDERMPYLRRIVFLEQRHHELMLQPFGLGKVYMGYGLSDRNKKKE
ncbi:MAG: hypothetical protein K0R57_776 [Paenibacillaceae bacterium]|nr:hypothetical protein [Paenibacillaceae bacterium]